MSVLTAGMAAVLEVEDEPEEKDAFNSLHEHARLEELARRNSLYLPHLRSAYPLEQFSTDTVTTHSKDTSRSSIVSSQSSLASSSVQGHTKDFARSSAVTESSRSSMSGGRVKDSAGSGFVEGHFKDISRSSVIEGDAKESARSRLSHTTQADVSHKVIVIFIILSLLFFSY